MDGAAADSVGIADVDKGAGAQYRVFGTWLRTFATSGVRRRSIRLSKVTFPRPPLMFRPYLFIGNRFRLFGAALLIVQHE